MGGDDEKNYAAVLHDVKDLRIDEIEMPKPSKGQVKINVKKVGICTSDLHYYENGSIGDAELKNPMIVGHESSGIVDEVGEGVEDLQVGDKVAIEPGVPCKNCELCMAGMYNICPKVKFAATPPVDGTMSNYTIHDATFCHKLPDNMTLEEGAMLEPLSVAIHAVSQGNVRLGDRVLVSGTGPIGLLCMLVAKAAGATCVSMTAHTQEKLDKAKKLGADHTVNITDMDPDEAAKASVEVFHEVAKGVDKRADVVIETSGSGSAIKTGIKATKSGGYFVLVGLGKPEVTVNLLEASQREVNIRGVFRYRGAYPIAIRLVSSGKINLMPLITHHYMLQDATKAFQKLKDGDVSITKIMIDCSTKDK
eukprot:Plantae.Rhodophyta-Purpureofilum_apyrenoidigerum.ctg33075.p1 GENE.Plantae.Rhodophyta-Purpureofilum_apyrenoidigerum.ctg33075~~Plantae.Rhodophyta-Purpureofilum_apyrenoidigerum.ctg33075.p1  ORF type:complete len:364 (+),score=84.26 Plantae.Rhodophyta-Purpureofilum_apyrenoidigerum.ctg33075:83-1174(+)